MYKNIQIKRDEMIRLLRVNGIRDQKVMKAMKKIPRHLFVPDFASNRAYDDCALNIEHNQTILQPFIVALMAQSAGLNGQSKILEIGTGSGYQSAILAQLCATVYTIEIIPQLAYEAFKLFKHLKIENIVLKVADGYIGWRDEAPFDAILVTAACRSIPPNLIKQLAVGGSMVIPLENMDHTQTLTRIVKTSTNNDCVIENLRQVQFVPMLGLVNY